MNLSIYCNLCDLIIDRSKLELLYRAIEQADLIVNALVNRNKLIRKITKTSELPGSYYTSYGNYRVVILLKLGLVSFTFSD